MDRIRPLQHPPTDNDDLDVDDSGGVGSREEPVSVVVAEQLSDAPSTAGATAVLAAAKAFVESRCPFLLHFSSYTLGVLLILCVTVIWVASSNWIQYIFGNLEFNKPYFLTYFNTTGFSLWNLGYHLAPSWTKVPWDDRERPQPILVEDQDVVCDESPGPRHGGEAGGVVMGSFGRAGRDAVAGVPLRRRQGGGARPYSSTSSSPLFTRREPSYGTDIRVWAVNNGYDPSILSSEASSVSSLSVEELIDVAALPDRTAAAPASPVAPFLLLVARDNTTAAGGRVRDGGGVQPRRRLARVDRVRPYARRKIWIWAALFCPFWFFANYLFNVSLSITSVASNTVLSATSSIWTLLLSYVLLHESVGPLKWLAVAFGVTGSILVGLSDKQSGSESGKNTVLGDITALISAFFYAVYTSILRFGLPDDERYSMAMVFGAVGVINFLCLWPGLVFVDLMRWEQFLWPTIGQFWPLLLNSLIGTNLSDVLWARSVVLTSPVVATLGLALTTPLAMIVDAILKKAHFSAAYVLGAVFVMLGFVMANLPCLQRWPRWMRLW